METSIYLSRPIIANKTIVLFDSADNSLPIDISLPGSISDIEKQYNLSEFELNNDKFFLDIDNLMESMELSLANTSSQKTQCVRFSIVDINKIMFCENKLFKIQLNRLSASAYCSSLLFAVEATINTLDNDNNKKPNTDNVLVRADDYLKEFQIALQNFVCFRVNI